MEKNITRHEIDVVNLIKRILAEKKSLFSFFAISAIIGVVVALNTPKAYTTEVILAPEMPSGGVGLSESLSDMVSSFGIDIGGKSAVDAIYPEIYPTIFASNDFILELFDIPVTLKGDSITKTYYDHLMQDHMIPFWSYPTIWISNLMPKKEEANDKNGIINTFRLTKKQEKTVGAIRSNIACLVDKKTNIISINVTDLDPQVSAILADTLQHRLQAYITDYRTKKARKDLLYFENLYRESKQAYIKSQQDYAKFSDANQEIILQEYRIKRDELENEMQLKYNIYNQITTQLQAAKAKIQEHTPAFTIIQEASVPNTASSTPRSYIVLFFIFFGFIADGLWVLYGQEIWKNWRNSKKGNRNKK